MEKICFYTIKFNEKTRNMGLYTQIREFTFKG